MDHRPQAWGRPRDDVYGAYDASYMNQAHGPTQHTQSPVVTGTSVIGIKYSDGIVIAADNLASYGSLARFTDVKRLLPFAGTSIADADATSAPSHLTAANLHRYLAKLFYARRNKFDPLWNHVLVGGLDEDSRPFLASADLRGTTYSAPSLATGFGSALAIPILRKVVPDEEAAAKLSKEAAVEAIKECMKVLYYRDARSMDTYSIAVVTKDGVDLKENEKLEQQSWAFADRIKGYGTQTV
ncbi:unnamed protein product [Parascedosporium putredinis]|uniref:Proteasome subunit beta n=1 Tax=Parascedosporium putredinis TaxID=1442378 RepID=A0A9P1H6B8_9PEZI|nr:unnamed protein product [Parascedosporium putredinis]CAI7998574.1 unnamed protein product [Parascedosporium putredinis]